MNKKPTYSFIEGKHYHFRIAKELRFGDKEYYVLEDIHQRKLLIEAKHYKNYNLAIGQNILCKVDKINCSGKIFVEPQHPKFREGDSYLFTITAKEQQRDKTGSLKQSYHIQTKDGFSALCRSQKDREIGSELQCKVKRIKKALVYAIPLEEEEQKYKTGESYPFTVIKEQILEDGKSYYVLQDKQEKKFYIDKSFYTYYKIEIGNTIECLVVKYSSKAYYFLEPKHPYYKIGEIYSFPIIAIDNMMKEEGIAVYTVHVNDIHDQRSSFRRVCSKHHPQKLISDVKLRV